MSIAKLLLLNFCYHFHVNYQHKTDRLGDKFLIHFFNPSNRWQIGHVSAFEKEDSVLEFMSEIGLAVALTVSVNILFYLKD